ncbi:MAG: hypothetical protein ACRD6U_01200 [Nitrososphaeraceae archaeon]
MIQFSWNSIIIQTPNYCFEVRVPLPALGSETLVRTRILQSVESGITIHRFNDITARMKNRMEK